MLAYIVRKLLYMPFILLGVIFITFVLFQMSTTPESLAKIQLGEKASGRQIYEYLSDKGQVSWTDAGNAKRDLLGQGVLDNKRTQFFVAGKLDDFADKRDDLHDRMVDLLTDIAEKEGLERAAHGGDEGADTFSPSDDLKDLNHKKGQTVKRLRENRIHISEALKDSRRIEETLIVREKLRSAGVSDDDLKNASAGRVAMLQKLDAMDIKLGFLREDVEILEAADEDADNKVLDNELTDARAAVRKMETAIAAGLKPADDGDTTLADDWAACESIRDTLAKVESIEPDLTYTPWYLNFIYYIRDIATLDFGDTNNRRPVMDVIREGMWPSLALAIPGFFIAELIGVFFGLMAAMYRQTKIDHTIVISAILLMSINAIALIMFGQKFLAADWNYFPITGYASGFGAVRFLILPILLYVIITFGERVRFNRIVMLDETNQDYVRTARAKGLSENTVLFKHILRNTLIPLITRWVVAIPSLYLGSLVLETFFAIPGLGYLTVEAIGNSDANVIRAVVVFGSVSFMLAALLSDVLYAVVDPRVKLN